MVEVNEDEVISFQEAANDRGKLPYDPDRPAEDGSVELGVMMAGDGSVSRWSVVPSGTGYVIRIDALSDGFDPDTFEQVWLDEPQGFLFVPLQDISEEKARWERMSIPALDDLPDHIPTTYQTVDDAYNAFLEVVYSSGRTESLSEIATAAAEMLNGYIDPEAAEFEDFRKALWNVCTWDASAHCMEMTHVANAMLCIRYPFLIPWGYNDDGAPWDDGKWFDHTLFTALPNGWGRRFGLELCEDLRNQAYDELPMAWTWKLCNMRPDQIKEKFGGLRWYGSAYGRGQDLIDVYENISFSVCIECGRADRTRITFGWISPQCWNETLPSDRERIKEGSVRYLPDPGNASWEEKYAATKVAEYATAVSTTSEASGSANMLKLLDEMTVTCFDKDGQRVENRSIGLLDGTPAPNGQPVHACQVIRDVATEIKQREDDPIDAPVTEAMEKLGLKAEDLPAWWGDDEEERDQWE